MWVPAQAVRATPSPRMIVAPRHRVMLMRAASLICMAMACTGRVEGPEQPPLGAGAAAPQPWASCCSTAPCPLPGDLNATRVMVHRMVQRRRPLALPRRGRWLTQRRQATPARSLVTPDPLFDSVSADNRAENTKKTPKRGATYGDTNCTNRALRRLTSKLGRDPVHSTRYGR